MHPYSHQPLPIPIFLSMHLRDVLCLICTIYNVNVCLSDSWWAQVPWTYFSVYLTCSSHQVATHTAKDDKWLVIDNEVYDITRWSLRHPGGSKVISHYAGQDASVSRVCVGRGQIITQVLLKGHPRVKVTSDALEIYQRSGSKLEHFKSRSVTEVEVVPSW